MTALPEQWLIDLVIEENLLPNEYFTAFEELGHWQMDTLKDLGLQPSDRLVDVGCGCMRLGVFAVRYLDDGNYYGIDAFEPFLRLAGRLSERYGLDKQYHLHLSKDFDFGHFGVRFDWAVAQSVFTHLSDAEIEQCMASLGKVMGKGKKFLFTYLWGHPTTIGFLFAGKQLMSRPATLDCESLAELGRRHGATYEELDLSHPTGQRVGLFTFE